MPSRTPSLSPETRLLRRRAYLTWPVFPLTIESLGYLAEGMAAIREQRPPVLHWNPMRRLLPGLALGRTLLAGLLPFLAFAMLGAGTYLDSSGSTAERILGILAFSLGSALGTAFLPAWLRQSMDSGGRRRYPKALAAAASLALAGSQAYGRALSRTAAASMLAWLVPAPVAMALGVYAPGSGPAFYLLGVWCLMPTVLAAATSSAAEWELQDRPGRNGGRKGRGRQGPKPKAGPKRKGAQAGVLTGRH